MSTFSQQTDEEIREKIEKMDTEELLQEVEKIKLELEDYDTHANKVCERMGMSHGQMNDYIHNKSNFSTEEWNHLEQARNEVTKFKKEIWNTIGKNPPENVIPQSDVIQSQRKKKQKRHFVGMKKQNWIPVD